MEVRLTVTVEPDFVVLLLRYLGGVDQRSKRFYRDEPQWLRQTVYQLWIEAASWWLNPFSATFLENPSGARASPGEVSSPASPNRALSPGKSKSWLGGPPCPVLLGIPGPRTALLPPGVTARTY